MNSLESTYNLDDTIAGNLYLINESNNDGLEIFIGSWPPAGGYSIFNEQGEFLYFNVWAIGLAEFHDNLMPGDTLKETISWSQGTNLYEGYSGLKLYSGFYKLAGSFWGNDSLFGKSAIKWFEITENGDPLSVIAHRHYELDDSIKVSFVIRNRIAQEKKYTLNSEKSINIQYFNRDGEKILAQKESIGLRENFINLKPKSDNHIYTYSISKNDSALSNLDGMYNLTITLVCEERTIEASVITFVF